MYSITLLPYAMYATDTNIFVKLCILSAIATRAQNNSHIQYHVSYANANIMK